MFKCTKDNTYHPEDNLPGIKDLTGQYFFEKDMSAEEEKAAKAAFDALKPGEKVRLRVQDADRNIYAYCEMSKAEYDDPEKCDQPLEYFQWYAGATILQEYCTAPSDPEGAKTWRDIIA